LDAFFAHDLEIPPGQTYNHEHEDNGVFSTPVSKGAVKIAPAASSQVIFAQFTDGSTCGDRNDGRAMSLMDTRADLLRALRTIDAASKKGEGEFLKYLAEKSKDRTRNAKWVLNYIRYRQTQRGTADTIDYVRKMLAVAATR
jgi:hypothetical protein